MMIQSKRIKRNGLLALSPMLVMALLFLLLGCFIGDFSKIPMLLVFIITSGYAMLTLYGRSTDQSIRYFSAGAGNPTLLFMVWIFILAGAFASVAREMGAVDATVNLTLYLLPSNMILGGVFLAACFVSISIGTSVGTVVALVPVATGLAAKTGIDLPVLVAAAVGGSFFGDNLSFISDTTIAATRSQGCRMNDKFRVNIRLVTPAAILTLILYVIMGQGAVSSPVVQQISLIKIIPYVVVIVTALMGVNVIIVLLIGNVLAGVIGGITKSFTFVDWCCYLTNGITSMGELILISMMAGGLLEIIRIGGGITWLIHVMTKHVRGKRAAELCIGGLVGAANLCTANNTVAILSVGKITNDIAERYHVDKRKSASLLDTFSCCVQALIPYGAQLLMASGLACISPLSIIPYMFYPMIVLIVAVLAIFVRYPKGYS